MGPCFNVADLCGAHFWVPFLLTHWSIHCKPQFAPKISKNLSKISKNLSKMGQDGAKMGPKPSQEGSQRRSEAIKKRKKHQDGITNTKMSRSGTPLDPILEAQGRPREAQDLPQRGPRAPKRPPKGGSRRVLILSSFFEVFLTIFQLFF